MTISDRIFERIRQLSITQKEFAEKAGIRQSTISEWKKNKTNPSSDKILPICKVLDVTPEWLLSGVDPAAGRVKNREFYVVDLDTDSGKLIMEFNKLDKTSRDKILGYVEAFVSMQPEKDRKGNE
ncbi:MAG: helix-turn-helix transcriptional regulator [Lachnospiraceae bacterium]|nr:helix-turn-helix transcriptional regulator [Lachnospiraceae bacterium]